MIEIIKEPQENKTKIPKTPKEVRQIGTVSGYARIYMEDYVHRFLHESIEEQQTYILLGEDYYEKEEGIFYIKAAFAIDNVSYARDLPVFSDDVWDEIYRKIRRYFPEYKILGWAVDHKGSRPKDVGQVEHIWLRHFAGEHRIAYLMDSLENEERFYVSYQGRLNGSEGYFVYCERNAAMQDYLTDYHIHVQEKMEQKRSIEDIVATPKEDVGQQSIARYRELLQREANESRSGVYKALVPVAALVLVVLSAVLVQNYMKLQDMEDEVEVISQEQAKEDVLETVSNAATKVESDGEDQEKTDEDTSSDSSDVDSDNTESKSDTTSANENTSTQSQEAANYLAQGYYVVQEGDQLTAISRKIYGTEDMVDEIIAANKISDSNHICAGDKLILP